MDASGNQMGASVVSGSTQQEGVASGSAPQGGVAFLAALQGGVASGSAQQGGKRRLRLVSRAASLPQNPRSKGGSKGAKVVKKARVLKRHPTPDLTNFSLKRAWFAATSADGLSGVLVPTIKKKGLEYAAITPTSCKWFAKLCFGTSQYKTINANAIREVLLRIWRGLEKQIGEAQKDF